MIITCSHLGKVYHDRGNQITALKDVNFSVGENEFVCIVGPSGCGKTTLLHLIAGLLPITTGEIQITNSTQRETFHAVMVFQEQGLFPWMTALENIGFGLEMQGVHKKEIRGKAMQALEKFNLSGFEHFYPDKLSGGMRQRVALARAFLSNPQVLLMDEPFGSLDAQTRKLLQLELLRVWRDNQKTVIYVTHDIEEAILLGDRVLVMSGRPGCILKEVSVPILRPRELSSVDQPDVSQLKWSIWNMLEEEALRQL